MTPMVVMSDKNNPFLSMAHCNLWCLTLAAALWTTGLTYFTIKREGKGSHFPKGTESRAYGRYFFKWQQFFHPCTYTPFQYNSAAVSPLKRWCLVLSTLWIWAWPCNMLCPIGYWQVWPRQKFESACTLIFALACCWEHWDPLGRSLG